MKHATMLAAWTGLLTLVGCVERRMTIVSDPPGAVAFVNGYQIGATPADVPTEQFIYYGIYDVQLFRDGYETLVAKQPVPPPWYQYPLIDFFAEHVWPFHVKDHRIFSYQLAPRRATNPAELLEHASAQRARGQALGPPAMPEPLPIQSAPPPTEPPAEAPARLGPPVTQP